MRRTTIFRPLIAALALAASWPLCAAPTRIDVTARPEGSFICRKAASHSRALAVEHATEASWGTQDAAASEGKHSAKMLR